MAIDADARATRIVIQLAPDTVPICGEIAADGGQPRLFSGWLELTRVLECFITEAAPHQAPTAGHRER